MSLRDHGLTDSVYRNLDEMTQMKAEPHPCETLARKHAMLVAWKATLDPDSPSSPGLKLLTRGQPELGL